MNYLQGVQVSTPRPALAHLTVCLPVVVMLIGNLVSLPKLACPSPFLLFYVRRNDIVEETKEAALGIREVEGARKEQYAIFQLTTGTLEDLGSFGRKELRDGIKKIRFTFLDLSLRYQNDGQKTVIRKHTKFTVIFQRKYLGRVSEIIIMASLCIEWVRNQLNRRF